MKNIFVFSLGIRWIGIARLPKALKHAGFNVIVLCHSESVLAKTQYIDSLYTYNSTWKFQQLFKKILREHEIGLVVPGGDDEVLYLKQLADKKRLLNFSSSFKKKLFASNQNHGLSLALGNKSELQNLASKLNVRTPANKVITSLHELDNELVNRKYPIVLKLDFGAAGTGVRICKNYTEAKNAYKELNTLMVKINFTTKIKERIKKIFDIPLYYFEQYISIQNYIEGTPCMQGIFASDGKILSSVTLLKIKSFPEKIGPSCVIQAIKHEQISKDVTKIISETKYTGFASFDFIIDQNNTATLLECNPRPTPIMHLTHLCGGNLCEIIKLHFGISNEINPYPEIKHPIIALFPNELKRDPESIYVKEHYHDIPIDDPLLLEYFNKDLLKNNISPNIINNSIFKPINFQTNYYKLSSE